MWHVAGPPPETGSCTYPAQSPTPQGPRVWLPTGGTGRRWACPSRRATPGNTGVTCPALSQNGECMGFLWSGSKSPHAQWLQATHGGQKSKMNLPGLKSRCWQGWFLLEAPGENLLLHLSQLLEIALILSLWPHCSKLRFYHPSSFSDSDPLVFF